MSTFANCDKLFIEISQMLLLALILYFTKTKKLDQVCDKLSGSFSMVNV